MRIGVASVLLAVWVAASGGGARAQLVDLRWGGRIQSDVRFRVKSEARGAFYDRRELPSGVTRNENTLNLELEAVLDRFAGVADVEFIWLGEPGDVQRFGDLSLREKTAPWRLEAHDLYVEATDLFVEGLDVRIGQQKVRWGAADQFNPTDNLNADDVEDPLLFGDQQANVMMRTDYTPIRQLSLTGVVVPVFKPALLPPSAGVGIAAVDRLPMSDPAVRHRIEAEKAVARELNGHPTVVTEARPKLPDRSLDNVQYAFQARTSAGGQDIALSYYNGRTDFPVPSRNVTTQSEGSRCNPDDPDDCIDGLLQTEVTLEYPRMQVVGLNVSGEVDALGWISDAIRPLGYWVEAALVLPEPQRLRIRQGPIDFDLVSRRAGEYDYTGGRPPKVVDGTPFPKWTVGVDYTFGPHAYANLQWVHGFPDEYGAGSFLNEGFDVRRSGVTSVGDETVECLVPHGLQPERCADVQLGRTIATETLSRSIGDYLVMGWDFHFDNRAGLFRLFTIIGMNGIWVSRPNPDEDPDVEGDERTRVHHGPFTRKGATAIVYPKLAYDVGGGFNLAAGAILKFGKPWTKFGDPAAGGSLVWTRARFSF